MASANNPFPDRNPKGRPEFWTEERIAALEATLWEHVEDPDSIDIKGWRGRQRLTMDIVNAICEKSPFFRQAYECAKALIGEKRDKMALKGNWHPGTVMRTDWCYDKDIENRENYLRDKELSSNVDPVGAREQAEIAALRAENERLKAQIAGD